MLYLLELIAHQMQKVLEGIMKRENVSAEKLSDWCKFSPTTFRRQLRREIKMDVSVFSEALGKLGYKILIVKNEDIV